MEAPIDYVFRGILSISHTFFSGCLHTLGRLLSLTACFLFQSVTIPVQLLRAKKESAAFSPNNRLKLINRTPVYCVAKLRISKINTKFIWKFLSESVFEWR